MVTSSSPVSIVREGYFRGNILDQLRKYSEGFKPLPAKETHEKYGLYIPETPSLVVVSKLRGETVLGQNRVNLYASFTSYSKENDLEMIAEFESKTGIQIQNDHPNLKSIGMIMGIVFQEIVKGGPQSMDLLAQM